MNSILKPARIEVVDALRGFAIMSIMLLHNLEHFDFWFFPEQLPVWMKALDSKIWTTLFFLFSGKSYAIFALLFGFSYYLMYHKQELKGNDFRGRFLWRLLILLGFGLINSVFYEGDILSMYALLGFTLVLVSRFNNRALFITAMILMAQPWEWTKLIYYITNPEYVPVFNQSYAYFDKTAEYITGNSFWAFAKGNFINGHIGVYLWSYEAGRFFQAPALFILGYWLGRKGYLHQVADNKKLWLRILISAVACFIILSIFKANINNIISKEAIIKQLLIILNSWTNFSFMLVLVALFLLGYQTKLFYRIARPLAVFGRMSLTNYVMQSIVGAIIYYGFGFALYQYTGATYCLLIGIVLFVLQLQFCRVWLKYHKQGPLEYLWHKATWIRSKSE
jgi:uncharacterized protein